MKRLLRFSLLFSISLVISGMLSGCEDRPHSNIVEAEKLAMSYMEDKYNKTFILNSCYETNFSFDKESVYIQARMKLSDSDKEYFVNIKPLFTDKDKDGFSDSYTVTSDTYMSDIIEPMIKEDMDDVLKEARFDSFVSYVENITQNGIGSNQSGLSRDFPLMTNDEFDLKKVMHDYDLTFFYQIYIPISEYDNQIKNRIIESYTSLFSADLVFFHVCTYSDEDFVKIKEHVINNDFNANEFEILNEISFDLS